MSNIDKSKIINIFKKKIKNAKPKEDYLKIVREEFLSDDIKGQKIMKLKFTFK